MPDRPKRYNARRSRSRSDRTLRDTSAAYRRQRLAILNTEPLCRYCRAQGRITPATILDHILALALGGTDAPANLAPACRDCNSQTAVAEAAYLRAGHDVRFARRDPALAVWFKLDAHSNV